MGAASGESRERTGIPRSVSEVFPEATGRLGEILDFGRREVAGGDLGINLDAAVGRDQVLRNCGKNAGVSYADFARKADAEERTYSRSGG